LRRTPQWRAHRTTGETDEDLEPFHDRRWLLRGVLMAVAVIVAVVLAISAH